MIRRTKRQRGCVGRWRSTTDVPYWAPYSVKVWSKTSGNFGSRGTSVRGGTAEANDLEDGTLEANDLEDGKLEANDLEAVALESGTAETELGAGAGDTEIVAVEPVTTGDGAAEPSTGAGDTETVAGAKIGAGDFTRGSFDKLEALSFF